METIVTDIPEEKELMFITAKSTGEEYGELNKTAKVDLDNGDTNDFEIRLPKSEWDRESIGYKGRVYIPGTEYGGIVKNIESISESNEVVFSGPTWRGMLEYKVVEPPLGEEHLILSGELNETLKTLIGDRFEDLFAVSTENTGVQVQNWSVDRYVTLYDAIMKLLDQYGYRLDIKYIQPEGLEYGYVQIGAKEKKILNEEYDQECSINLDIEDYRAGVNHLVCAGEGENQDRTILHLYVQEDGTIGDEQYYYGLDEVAAVYIFTSADANQLRQDGTKRLKDLQNYKKCQMTIEDVDLEIGDIVAGYDEVTDTTVMKPIKKKILKINDGQLTIDYEVKGDD